MRAGLEATRTHNTPIGPSGADCEEVCTLSSDEHRARSGRIPELDGLRGLAVAAVVAYHAWPGTVPGGWLGVSVFFTLSGYLITGILIREHEASRASLGRFWATRARRLLPVALVSIAGVLAATAIVDPDSVRRVSGDALASIAYAQNWREAAAPGGYGAIFDTGLRPLAHMWSLSIEEQAYLLLPLLTLWLGPRRMLLVGGLAAVAGTIVWWGSPDAYYATPVRLLEVLAGAALAVWMAEGRPVRVPPVVGAVAAGLILVGVALLDESHALVSRGALPVAALSSVLVIATVLHRRVRALGARPLVWLGYRSYAIYLFHWPLLVMLNVSPWVAVAATGVLAEISHPLLEWPIRSQRIVIRRPVPVFAGATFVAVAFAGTALILAPRPATVEEIEAATAIALADVAVARVVPPDPAAPTTTLWSRSVESPSIEPFVGAPVVPEMVASEIPLPARPTVMVLGDSTAAAIEPAVSGWVGLIGGVSIDAAVDGCSPMFARAHNDRWYTNLIARPTACRTPVVAGTDLVLVVDHGVALFDHFDREADEWTDLTDPSFITEMTARYEDMIADAARAAATVVFTTPPIPWPAFGEWLDYHTGTEIQRRVNYITMVNDLAERFDDVHVLEFGAAVDADPARYSRDDGLHLDSDTGAVNAVVDLIVPRFVLIEESRPTQIRSK
jgi:peptidoglycan/LPS O-acetylase OafA/YrhL